MPERPAHTASQVSFVVLPQGLMVPNPVTTTLADYLLPDADNVPTAEIYHVESPAPHNPLGVKGAGEGGTIPAAAAVVSAVEDALRPFGVQIDEAPILPERICELIDAARQNTQEAS